MGSLNIRVLGSFEARLSTGEAIKLPIRKAEMLLAYLALHAGDEVSREKLASLLWSERADAQARGSLERRDDDAAAYENLRFWEHSSSRPVRG